MADETAERIATLGGHEADRLHLRIQHRVDRDEVRPDHVPVHVLERQREVVQRVEPVLEQLDDLLRVVGLHSWHGVRHRDNRLPVSCDMGEPDSYRHPAGLCITLRDRRWDRGGRGGLDQLKPVRRTTADANDVTQVMGTPGRPSQLTNMDDPAPLVRARLSFSGLAG
jgi:hypothetical protein